MKEGDIIIYIGDEMYLTKNKSYKITNTFIRNAFGVNSNRIWVLDDIGYKTFFYEDDPYWIELKKIRKQKLQKLNLM